MAKVISILTFLVCFSFITSAQIKKVKKIPALYEEDYWAFIPASSFNQEGITKRFNAFYMAKFEVTNIMYNEFLSSIAPSERALHERKIDNDFTVQSTEIQSQYGIQPGFAYFPVVNISMEDAQAFTKWLTEAYHSNEKRAFKKVEFFLPSEAQWELAARGGNDNTYFPWGTPYTRNADGKYLANYLRYPETAIMNYFDENGDYQVQAQKVTPTFATPARIASYPENPFETYDQAGNVAELTTTPYTENDPRFTVKGGSFEQTAYWLQISTREVFRGPNYHTGFRLAMRVIEK